VNKLLFVMLRRFAPKHPSYHHNARSAILAFASETRNLKLETSGLVTIPVYRTEVTFAAW
jgi:hypothetical protein